MPSVRTTDTIEDAWRLAADWDALAVARSEPYCAPAWMLAWWRHVAPRDALLRIISIHDGPNLLAIAPLYAVGDRGITRYRMLGSSVSLRTQPLAVRGRQAEAGALIAAELVRHGPLPDTVEFDGIDAHSGWPEAIRAGWPGRYRPRTVVYRAMPAPTVTLDGVGSYESWLQEKSRNFRQQARRRRRQLEDMGAKSRLNDGAGRLDEDLTAFWFLHHGRWKERGGSAVLTPRVQQMLLDAGSRLTAADRFRLWMLETKEAPISAQLLLSAGGDTSYWLGGFDEDWAGMQPAMQTLLAAIEHACGLGDHRVDLGGGDQAYKYRMSDGEHELSWTLVVPVGHRLPLVVARLAPLVGSRAVLDLVPTSVKDRIKRRLGRPTSGHDRLNVKRWNAH